MFQSAVPQFIEVEDKIIGPLTMRQFLYLVGGGVGALVSWSLADTELFVLLALLCAVISLALAFLKLNGRPALQFGLSFAQYLTRPQMRIWKKELTMDHIGYIDTEKRALPSEMDQHEFNKGYLRKLSLLLDMYGEKPEDYVSEIDLLTDPGSAPKKKEEPHGQK